MPRTTHPVSRSGHSRAHLREQRARWDSKRWRQAKRRYPDLRGNVLVFSATEEDELTPLAQAATGQPGPHFSLHPEVIASLPVRLHDSVFAWPFHRPRNDWQRNPWTRCSCEVCRWNDEPARTTREAAWRKDWSVELAEGWW